jgi:long-chain fatty acid transport protein
MTSRISLRGLVAALAALGLSPAVMATNGMLLEGYGPVAAGMGGASMAHDTGMAAAVNNPATLALGDGRSRLDLAIGTLGPRVSAAAGPMTADSAGTRYVMPALGWGRRTGPLSYGVALFAQGGMGTEYDAQSFLAMGSGAGVRSELGVGRFMVPLAYQVTQDLAVGGSVDWVWSSLDLQMAASGMQLGGLVTSASGNLAMALPALGGAPWTRIDFSDSSKFSGAAKSTGWAAKIGAVYKVTPTVNLGVSYHGKTSLKDMKTGATSASMSAAGGFSDSGRMVVEDFQMPAQTAVGMAWQASASTLVAADVKRIGWSDVMESFRMRYESSGMGGSVSFALPQSWKDQTVFQLGVAHKVGTWTLRAGLNASTNPIPDGFVNPLFPAIVKRHYTLGAGTAMGPGEVNVSASVAPQVTVRTPDGLEIRHGQFNLQLMYSVRY